TAGTGAARYQLSISRDRGRAEEEKQDQGGAQWVTVNGLPINGGTLYVRLWTLINGAWQSNDYTYAACASSCGTSPAAAITSPLPGTTLSGSSVLFQWTAGTGAARYQLSIS